MDREMTRMDQIREVDPKTQGEPMVAIEVSGRWKTRKKMIEWKTMWSNVYKVYIFLTVLLVVYISCTMGDLQHGC